MNKLIAAALLLVCVSSSGNAAPSISVAGRWHFALDPNNVGVTQGWFGKSLPEAVTLPGSTDENRKGAPNNRPPDMQRLSRLYEYTGPAWLLFQHTAHVQKLWARPSPKT